MNNEYIVRACLELIKAFESGDLGQTEMPENANPFGSVIPVKAEESLGYFTLPMALNYQRNSYELWKSALRTWQDSGTRDVFDVRKASEMNEQALRQRLVKYKLALQPNKHIATWQTIARTVFINWGSFENMLISAGYDYLKLKNIIQKEFKKGFPYLSGPKIFNYWCYILILYCGVKLENAEYIDIAPDTHITKCSVRLGVITEQEAVTLTKEQISACWREILDGSGINPIDMHAPLWFWSRNGFLYNIKKGEGE